MSLKLEVHAMLQGFVKRRSKLVLAAEATPAT
jgi:hypothetical protein